MAALRLRRSAMILTGLLLLPSIIFTCFVLLSASIVSETLTIESMEATGSMRRCLTAVDLIIKEGGSRVNYSSQEADTLAEMFRERHNNASGSIFRSENEEPYMNFTRKLNSMKKRGPGLLEHKSKKGNESWIVFNRGINQNYLYNPNDEEILQNLLDDLSTREIIAFNAMFGGSQIKLMLTVDNGAMMLFKPKRFGREHETWPNHIPFNDFERHQAEIAGYHMDKLLGLGRVPPTVGRYLNVSRDLQGFAVTKFKKTFFKTPYGELCFYGLCPLYCDRLHAVCEENGHLEGSASYFLPQFNSTGAHVTEVKHPWLNESSDVRPSNDQKHHGVDEREICLNNRSYAMKLFMTRRFLPDLMDMAVYDFLIGNIDRHHVEKFIQFGDKAYISTLDQGRGFGKSEIDFDQILTPLMDCCLIRLSTLARLVKLYQGPDSLSHVLRESMSSDPVAPILWEPHLDAVDRRLLKILDVVKTCVDKVGSWDDVVLDDGIL